MKPLRLAAVAAVGWHVGPAATWLSPVRAAVAPSLDTPMPPSTVAVTFDDGPHPEGTLAVLDVLATLGWRATFFVLGSQVEAWPDLAREIARRGHEVGVHGYAHRYLLARPPRGAYDDLRRAVDVVGTHVGVTPRWWRPPYGVLTGAGLAAAHRLRLRPVLWSAWGRDWDATATPASIAARVARGRLDGGTVLLHDSDVASAPGSWRRTAESLPLVADEMGRRHLDVRPLPVEAWMTPPRASCIV